MNIYLMMNMILILAANIILAVCALNVSKKTGKQILTDAGILTVSELVLLYAADAVLFRFTLCEVPAAPLCAIALTGVLFSAWMHLGRKDGTPGQRFFAAAMRMVCIALLLELVVFTGRCYGLDPVSETRSLAESGAEIANEHAVYEGSGISVTGNAELLFHLNTEAENVQYVQLELESEDTFYQSYCSMTDDNFSQSFQKIDETWMNASQETMTFAIAPYGTLYDVKVTFRDVDERTPVKLAAFTTMSVKPYSFSILRFLLAAGILCLIAAIQCFGWHKLSYDRRKPAHNYAVAATLLLCITGILTILPADSAKLVEYSESIGVNAYDPYAQTFDAWQKGQVYLDVEVDPLLLELENPYDRSARDASGARYEWDKAFYDGKYYSYFGISPVIFVYYPLYLTTGKIPTVAMASAILSVASVILLFALVLTAVRKYCRRVNLLLLLCGLIAAAASSGIFLCAHYADRYYVAITAGICFLYLFLWLGLLAVKAKKQISRCLLLAGCGLAIAAAVLSRPTLALYAVLLVPPFLGLIRRKNLNIRQKAVSVTSFAVPLVIGAAVTMAYNAARFSSPLDFGSAYQLTVSNTAANRVTLAEFPAAMVHYFLNPLDFGSVFPFVKQAISNFATTSHYVYVTAGFGAFLFFCIPVGFLLLGAVTGRKVCRAEKRWTFRLAFLMAVLMAFLDYCMGGYNSRYLCDILPVLAVFSVLVILDAQRRLRTVPAAYGAFSRGAAVVLLLAPVCLYAMFLSCGEYFTMWKSYPDLYFELRNLIVFWR